MVIKPIQFSFFHLNYLVVEILYCFVFYEMILQQLEFINIIIQMSNFRIQRRLTQNSPIKLKPYLSNPPRVKSYQSKQSIQRLPKKIEQQQLKRMIKRVQFRQQLLVPFDSKEKMQEGIKAFKQKNIAKAVEVFKQVRKNGEKSAELSYYLGSCCLNLGKHQSSIMYLNQCLVQDKKNSSNAYLYIAINFKLLGNLKQAIRILEEGVKIFPLFQQGHFYKAKLLMKVGNFEQSSQSFEECLQINSSNDLATIFLGDCLRKLGKQEKAMQKYKSVIMKNGKYLQLAVIRQASILFQRQNYVELINQLTMLMKNGFQHAEINYYLGLSCIAIGRKHQGIVYLQYSLNNAKQVSLMERSLKAIVKVSIQDGNFFEAQHQISRIPNLGLNQAVFTEWKLFIQGVNDLIRRKNSASVQKLLKALDITSGKKPSKQSLAFLQNIYPYAAYSLFLNKRIIEAIQLYSDAISMSKNKQQLNYCKSICQGISYHDKKQYDQSYQKFTQAYEIQNRIQAIFLSCISMVQKYKNNNQDKDQIFDKVQAMMKKGMILVESGHHLFLFYYSLVLLFRNQPCLNIIQKAIKYCEDPISEYFFIEALALQIQGNIPKAIDSISKAIQLDPNIQQFYRQRSKYYFLQEQFQNAINDCKMAENMVPDDQQLPLLLSFYYYLNGQYIEAYDYVQKKVKPQSGKLKEFQQALYLRLGLFDRLGPVGQLLMALKQSEQLTSQIFDPVEQYIKERYQYSQFSVYFYHLILANGYANIGEYQKSLTHLFGCLQEIQSLVDEREAKKSSFDVTWQETEEMLDQIKLNIVIVSLMKQSKSQAEHFINVFINQTESKDLKQSFQIILDLINNQTLEGQCKLSADNYVPRLSDGFPDSKIPLNNQTLITKILISYPVKLKFTIAPQFDPAYLLNFDNDKVEYKIPPPWMKAPAAQVNFTNSVRNESIVLSESQVSEKMKSKRSVKQQLKDHLKLDKSVEEKLKKIMMK